VFLKTRFTHFYTEKRQGDKRCNGRCHSSHARCSSSSVVRRNDNGKPSHCKRKGHGRRTAEAALKHMAASFEQPFVSAILADETGCFYLVVSDLTELFLRQAVFIWWSVTSQSYFTLPASLPERGAHGRQFSYETSSYSSSIIYHLRPSTRHPVPESGRRRGREEERKLIRVGELRCSFELDELCARLVLQKVALILAVDASAFVCNHSQ
jgi:hypothetical protein